ncbi:uncharacterized protein [Neodiprion pinetum]|uniref:uncharacterized protein n=1 Tax=Neodiprion pinetum TaxID=441929 RepID=UPI001EE0B87D|nr:uncharacterized protein LOC124219481 [Neodiprion pinetum]XP_046483031.1 uncharacterized protein LOC124219481 [Neodiprion pinetum]
MEEYIRVEVLPDIFTYYEKTDYKLVNFELQPLESDLHGFSSNLLDLNLSILVKKDGILAEEAYSLLVKCIKDDCIRQKLMESWTQFSNETQLYRTICPIFKKLIDFKLFPDCPYAVFKKVTSKENMAPTDGIVIIENLTKEGYKLAQQKILDMGHCVSALEHLGRWHALSLISKELHPEQFNDQILTGFKECTWTEKSGATVRQIIAMCVTRLFNNAKYEENPQTYKAMKILERHTENMREYMETLIARSSKSKLSVVCHGDYCRNNILFKYDENERPASAIAIDYQNLRFGSVALDLSYFIYMNADKEVRENSLTELIKKYHASLVSTMKEVLISETKRNNPNAKSLVLPSLDSILEDFRQFGVFGLIYGISFMPSTMGTEEEMKQLVELITNPKGTEFRNAIYSVGGDAGTNTIIQMFETAVTLDQVIIE